MTSLSQPSTSSSIELDWCAEKGRGYFPVDEYLTQHGKTWPYDTAYLTKYDRYAESDLGKKLRELRLALVERHWNGHVVDVGCASGDFVIARIAQGLPTDGYDIIPGAIARMRAAGRWNPMDAPVDALTFWDSLEHIKVMERVLEMARKWCFVAMPIYNSYDKVLASKHFRKDEHFHYFTHFGFVAFMWEQGFRLRESTDAETLAGREGIRSFAFERVR